jgi:hypothetical protein
MWVWTAALVVAGAALLAWSIDAVATWAPPPNSVAVLTLNQLLGFLIASLLLLIASMIVGAGIRRHRRKRRRLR